MITEKNTHFVLIFLKIYDYNNVFIHRETLTSKPVSYFRETIE